MVNLLDGIIKSQITLLNVNHKFKNYINSDNIYKISDKRRGRVLEL